MFYNPNIHPLPEYENRKKALDDYSKKNNITVHFDTEYRPEDFFELIADNEKSPKRCSLCWQLRLRKTAECANKIGIESFSTTLLVSPYQDIEKIGEIGEEIADDFGVKFVFQDFRDGFRDAHKKAKDLGMYCQKYCGCIFSKKERYERN